MGVVRISTKPYEYIYVVVPEDNVCDVIAPIRGNLLGRPIAIPIPWVVKKVS